MRSILRPTPALLLVLLAAGCGEPAPSGGAAGETASSDAAGTADAGAGGAAAEPATSEPEPEPKPEPKLVAASGDRPAMLDTGIDLSHLRDEKAPKTSAFPDAPTAAKSPTAQGGKLPPGGLALTEGEEITDFGEMLEGDKADATWRLESTGENPLVIERVRPSCGCTAAEIELIGPDGGRSVYTVGEEIPPGTDFELGATINTANRQGPFASNVAIYSNDPASPMRLQLKADVKPVLEVSPRALDFGRMTSGDVKTGTVTISTTVLDPFHLELDTQNVIEPLSAELTPVDPNDEGRSKTWELAVELGPDTPEGMRRYMLRLQTDVPRTDGHDHAEGEAEAEAEHADTPMRELVCTVTANVSALVVASPNFVSFGVVRPGQPIERSVKIETLDEDFQLPADPSYRFQSLTKGEFTAKEYFSAELAPTPDAEGRSLDLTLRLEGLPDDYSGSFGGMVSVAVDHPTKEEIDVRFSGVVKPGIPATSEDN